MSSALPSTARFGALATLCAVMLCAVMLCAMWLGLASAVLAQPTAPTLDQRALKVLAEARDLVAAGRSAESIPFYAHALDLVAARQAEPTVAHGNLLVEYGEVLTEADQAERARSSLEHGLAILDGLDDEVPVDDLAAAVSALADLDRRTGRLDAAQQGYERSLRLLQATGDTAEILSLRVRLGLVDEQAERLDDAFAHYRQAVVTARDAGVETPSVATALHRGAAILYRQGRSDSAVPFFRQALEAARRQFGTAHWQTAATSKNLALALERIGEPAEARVTADDAARMLGRACAPGSQASDEVRDLCTEVSKLRSRLANGEPATASSSPQPSAASPSATQPSAAPAAPAAPPSARPPSPPPKPSPAPTTPSREPWGTQVSSQRSPADAERIAEQMRVRFPSLRAQTLLIVRAELASGVWHRVVFGSFDDRDGAVALCESLKRAGLEGCLPVEVPTSRLESPRR